MDRETEEAQVLEWLLRQGVPLAGQFLEYDTDGTGRTVVRVVQVSEWVVYPCA